jgi:hypothetical protein
VLDVVLALAGKPSASFYLWDLCMALKNDLQIKDVYVHLYDVWARPCKAYSAEHCCNMLNALPGLGVSRQMPACKLWRLGR